MYVVKIKSLYGNAFLVHESFHYLGLWYAQNISLQQLPQIQKNIVRVPRQIKRGRYCTQIVDSIIFYIISRVQRPPVTWCALS